MKTISAKELRLHLDQVLDRVLSGEDIIVSHRFKGPVRLSTVHPPRFNYTEKLAGLHTFDVAGKRISPFATHKSIKELYNESLTNKYAS